MNAKYFRKSYLQYFYFSSRTSGFKKRIEDRDVADAARNICDTADSKAYGFRFFDEVVVLAEIDSIGVIECSSNPINASPLYFVGGKIYSQNNLCELPISFEMWDEDKLTMIETSRLCLKPSDKIIQTRTGDFTIFDDRDCILLPNKGN